MAAESIEGLTVLHDVITEEEEKKIIAYLDGREWKNVNPANKSSRRVQQFGYGYSYKDHSLQKEPPLECEVLHFANFLRVTNVMDAQQCIVNEYFQTQGIAAHIDSTNFGDTVAGLSIGEDATMIFKRDTSRIPVFLPRRSVVIMKGESRYKYTHEIPSTKSYIVNGVKVVKSQSYRRISLTYRQLK